MSVSKEAISVRSTRLTKEILGRNEAASKDGLNREKLLDAFIVLFDECSREKVKRSDRNVADFLTKYKPVVEQTKLLRVSMEDFSVKSLIGKGYFGDVHLVVEKSTKDVYAMKQISKSALTASQVKEERDIMAMRASEWITSLQYAFQDARNLYLVMEYLPGGDLLSLMIRNGAFDEETARFYLAELTLGLNALHQMGYVHRDVKPENILVDRCGHLKLADFGNAALINKDGNVISLSPVGTPDYIAPELLKALTSAGKGQKTIHDASCDFWSMGIIGYELVTEVTPFHHDSVNETYAKILAHCEKSSFRPRLTYPEHLETSEPFRHLIENLLTGPENRLTHARILKHPFFREFMWSGLRQREPPIIPTLKSDDDVSNFEDVDRKSRRNTYLTKSTSAAPRNGEFSGENLPFIGYSFIHEEASAVPEELQRPTEKHHDAKVKEMTRLGKAQCEEIRVLQNKLISAEKSIAEKGSAERNLKEARAEVVSLKEQLREKLKELASCRTEVKTLKSSLKVEEDQRIKNETTITEILRSNKKKWEKIKNTSDQAYEKQIAEKAAQIAHLNEKLSNNEVELRAKKTECFQLLDTIEKYRDVQKKSKEQLSSDRVESEGKMRNLEEVYDSKIQELKRSLNEEKNAHRETQKALKEFKKDLESHQAKQTILQDARRVSERVSVDLRDRMTQEIEENRKMREQKVTLERQLEELTVKFDDLEKENQNLHAEIEKYTAESHRSSVNLDDNFRSCKSSFQDIHQAVEEQWRTDLERANERVEAEKRRADGLEAMTQRLEAVIARLESTDTGRSAPRASRIAAEVEKAKNVAVAEQQARTAMLSMWKLEKDNQELKGEAKLQSRRAELMEEKCRKLGEEKSRLESKLRSDEEMLASKSREIERIQKEIDHLRASVDKETQHWRTSERELMDQKILVGKHMARIQKLEEIIEDGKRTLCTLQQENKSLNVENKKINQEICREREEAQRNKDKRGDIQAELENFQMQYGYLKEACNVMEVQLTELEAMVDAERKLNAGQKISMDELLAKLRAKEENSLKLKQMIHTLETEKRAVEAKLLQSQNDLVDARDQLEKVSSEFTAAQTHLVETTTNLIDGQEQLELTKNEVDNLQLVSRSYMDEVRSLKEENTRILTDLFMAKEEISRQAHELSEASMEISEHKHEIDHLNGLLSEQKNYYVQRDIKCEATLAQHKKLIDYLQAKVEQLPQKKKNLLEKLFGGSDSHRKENVTPNVTLPMTTGKLKTTQEQLKKARDRNSQLTEKLLKAKTEIRSMKEPSAPVWEEPKQASDVESEKEQRKEFQKREEETLSRHSSGKRSYRMHHLEMTMEGTDEPGVNCIVCHDPVMTSNTFWRCRVCRCTVHRKCRGKVTSSCDGESILPPLEAIDEVDARPTERDVYETTTGDSYRGELLFKPTDLSPPVLVHCIYEVNDETILLGCETGLYSLHLQESQQLIPIEGLDCVNYIAITPTLAKVILIGNGGEHLYQCDLRHLLARGRRLPGLQQPQAEKLEVSVLNLPFANRQSNERWHFARIRGENERLDEAIVIAATTSRILIMRFDTGIGKFRPTRTLDTATPVTGVLFTRHTAIVSSDKFFEIDLDSLTAEEFVDLSDASLASSRSWQPMAAFQITEGEFLLCFSEYGVFTDEYGCRSRPGNISWTYTPTGFSFRNGILFVTHYNMIQVIRIRRCLPRDAFDVEDSAQAEMTDDPRSFIALPRPKILSSAGKLGVYVLATENDTEEQKMVLVDGGKALGEVLTGSLDTLTTISTASSSPQTSSSGSLKRVKSFAV
ncbi:citron rho-interacting kinase [Phlebotomus argentipes]|uniref:citron rho-interacting kinase n=1 Tax=Phlebotomus argentipes TaxID=94469 RepID=UPI00289353AE|nr:citron rho-interacting kinase [Phlebotomus argentipes]